MSEKKLVKKIWMYWHQGYDKAPPAIDLCIAQWKNLHPDWEFFLLDENTIYNYAEPLPIKKETLERMVLPHRSDLLRTQLLIKHGGVWADPTTFPLVSLNDWLPDSMGSGYFFFYKPGRDRIIANWFIASYKNNETLKVLYNALISYWNNNNFKNTENPKSINVRKINRYINRNFYWPKLWFSFLFRRIFRLCTYMVYHHMFYNIISANKKFGENFKLMTKIPAKIPLSFKKEILDDTLDPVLKEIVDSKKAPMIKLDWRKVPQDITRGSNLDYLINNN